MQAPNWYSPTDQNIFQDNQFITQEPYRLNEYEAQNIGGGGGGGGGGGSGITNTSAFTNSGAGINLGGTGGNVFGYGTAIKPVSLGQYGAAGYSGGLPGNVQQTGTGRNMMADLDPNYDPDDPDSQWMSPHEYFTGKRKQLPAMASGVLSMIPWVGNFVRNKIENRMNDPRLGKSTYKVGGMDYSQKGLYDTLAGSGMLFEGPGGLKTLTGKNFTGKGYVEGQQDIWDQNYEGRTAEDIEAELRAYAKDHNITNWENTYKAKKYFESKAVVDKSSELGKYLTKQKIAETNKMSGIDAAEVQKAIARERGDPGAKDYGNPGGTSGAMTKDNVGYYCFDPSTCIQMADGGEKKIKDIQLGDNTRGGEVTGVFQFKATDEIHDYKGVTVAGSHYVKEDGRFIMVKDSPLSVKIDKIPVVYSLDTTGRRIFINDIEFADYNGDGVAKNFLDNAGVDLTGFDKEVLRQVENRLL